MTNDRTPSDLAPRLGPLPASAAGLSAGPTRAQAAVLEELERLGRPATLVELTEATSLHVNTVREHLSALESAGLVRRGSAAPKGRGRPAVTFTAVAPSPSSAAAVDYAGLAAALATALQSTSARPAADARAAGRQWGVRLAEASGTPRRTALSRRAGVVDLLDRLGFAPSAAPQARTVRLTRCPLLAVAQQHPDVVCSLHLGVVEGALEQWDGRDTQVGLTPFAEPGACLLHMASRTKPSL